MFEKILVPLDGSARAEAILPQAESLALEFASRLILLHVIEPGSSLMSPHGSHPDVSIELTRQKKDELERYLAGKKGEFREKGVEVETVLAQGPVVETIIQTAAEYDVDLIAMASHGRTGLQRVFYGSVAAGVLQSVDRPLLLVRSRRL
ncbi:MAG: universal stress protein [Anaerolineales bacterium]|jgi:nucleotide-binding universal stress UspA family protein